MASLNPFQMHQDTEDAPWWSSLLLALVLVIAAASTAVLIEAG
ncbi:hypothetical protein [Piscinibacter koreensis]|nr:hypothetical protein [Schlegelella koreensis]